MQHGPYRNPRCASRTSRRRLVLASMGFALVVGLVFHWGVGYRKPHGEGLRLVSEPVASPTNPTANRVGGLRRPPTKPDSEADRLVRATREWQRRNPAYHMRVETTGPESWSISEVYQFTNESGEPIRRIASQIFRPVAAKVVMGVEKDRVVVFFPKTNRSFEISTEEDVRKTLGIAGVVTGGQYEGLPAPKPRSCFVEAGQGFKALTMMFSQKDLQVPGMMGDLFMTVRIDEAGRPLEVEHLTLGRRVTSKLTYLSFDPKVVNREAPSLPAKSQPLSKTLREIMEEELNLAKSKPAHTI